MPFPQIGRDQEPDLRQARHCMAKCREKKKKPGRTEGRGLTLITAPPFNIPRADTAGWPAKRTRAPANRPEDRGMQDNEELEIMGEDDGSCSTTERKHIEQISKPADPA